MQQKSGTAHQVYKIDLSPRKSLEFFFNFLYVLTEAITFTYMLEVPSIIQKSSALNAFRLFFFLLGKDIQYHNKLDSFSACNKKRTIILYRRQAKGI